MQTTGNYGLKKPDGTDTVDISILNGNMDIVDAELKKRALVSQIPTIPSSLPANGGNSATVGGFSASGTPSTTEKSNLVGMINELFQSGTNGKNDIYNAISAKGTTPASKNFTDLVTAIGNINTGKKFASGTVTSSTTTKTYEDYANANTAIFNTVEVSGLTFTPSIIIVSLNARIAPTIYKADGLMCSSGNIGYIICSSLYGWDGYKMKNASVTSTGFSLPASYPSTSYNWVAIE